VDAEFLCLQTGLHHQVHKKRAATDHPIVQVSTLWRSIIIDRILWNVQKNWKNSWKNDAAFELCFFCHKKARRKADERVGKYIDAALKLPAKEESLIIEAIKGLSSKTGLTMLREVVNYKQKAKKLCTGQVPDFPSCNRTGKLKILERITKGDWIRTGSDGCTRDVKRLETVYWIGSDGWTRKSQVINMDNYITKIKGESYLDCKCCNGMGFVSRGKRLSEKEKLLLNKLEENIMKYLREIE